jgi:hypothetical protein
VASKGPGTVADRVHDGCDGITFGQTVLCLCLLGKSGFDDRLKCTGDEMLIGIGQFDLIAFTAAITTNFILKFGEFNSKAHPRAANAKGAETILKS